jgi:hypothetical protein
LERESDVEGSLDEDGGAGDGRDTALFAGE